MLYDELKALAVSLSPTTRVSGSEVADVLSALIAFVEHGPAVIDAAHDGPQALADFYHDHIVAQAVAAGEPAPAKGLPLERAVEPGRYGPPPAVTKSDFDKLAAAVASIAEALVFKDEKPEPPTGAE